MLNGTRGNFICAGCDTFAALLKTFMTKHDNFEHLNNENYAVYLKSTIDKYLFTYGTGLDYKKQKLLKNHRQKIVKYVKDIIETPFMKETKLYVDSGGFQVSMGAIATKDMPGFIDDYHTFLRENNNLFTHAFMLDLPPGPGSANIFNSYNQIEDLNRLSYRASSNLPQEIKDKMIYIHHFRSPSLYNTWSKFLWDENLAEGYKYFGTGGIVVNQSSDMSIPVIIYTIPLSSVLRYVKSKEMKSFSFHILGGANFGEILLHKLFSYHIKEYHHIDCNITYDSSALFKGLAIGRFIPVLNTLGELEKMDIRSSKLHLKFEGAQTIEDKVYELLNGMAAEFGFKLLDKATEPIYDLTRDTFTRAVHMYLISYMLYIYRQLEITAEEYVKVIYPLYKDGKVTEFDVACNEYTRKINQGRETRKQQIKSYSIYKSLKLLENMDEEYNKYLVEKFMNSSDLASLNTNGGTIKFA